MSSGASDTYRWVPGTYQVEGEIRYRSDTPNREAVERVRIVAEVTVDAGGPVSVETLAGPCRVPEEARSARARTRNGRVVSCGDTVFTLWPDHDRVSGTLSTAVTESRRTGACVQYTRDDEGNRVCANFRYSLTHRSVRARANLRTTYAR